MDLHLHLDLRQRGLWICYGLVDPQLLWQCYDRIHHQWQIMKHWRQFVHDLRWTYRVETQALRIFKLRCGTLTTVSIVGIMVLEKQVLQMEDDGQSSRKRARTSVSPTSEVTTSWIELAKLVSGSIYVHCTCMFFDRAIHAHFERLY